MRTLTNIYQQGLWRELYRAAIRSGNFAVTGAVDAADEGVRAFLQRVPEDSYWTWQKEKRQP